jgi:UDP-glucose 4-epimerase
VYGNPDVTPVSESARLRPISSYGAVKVAIEKFIGVAEAEWGLQPVILRPSNPFGERQGHAGVQGLISTLLKNAISGDSSVIYGDGSAVRDYIYVGDVAKLVGRAAASDRCGEFNVGYGAGFSINQIITMIETVTGLEVRREYRPARGFDVKEVVLDSSLAQQCFGWQTTVTIEAGIERAYAWLKQS